MGRRSAEVSSGVAVEILAVLSQHTHVVARREWGREGWGKSGKPVSYVFPALDTVPDPCRSCADWGTRITTTGSCNTTGRLCLLVGK